MIVALNMSDVAKQRGYRLDRAALERALGVPVVETVAVRPGGERALVEAIDRHVFTPHTAGITAPAMRLADMSAERLQRMFEVNVLGAYLCAREAARVLSRSRGGNGGSVVLVSSGAARLGSPGTYVDYAGSKAALDTLAIGLGKELGVEGVRVNSVRPGLVETEMQTTTVDPERARKLGPGAPLGRPGQPDEIAAAIVWLLSDSASYVTGSVLDLTGGL